MPEERPDTVASEGALEVDDWGDAPQEDPANAVDDDERSDSDDSDSYVSLGDVMRAAAQSRVEDFEKWADEIAADGDDWAMNDLLLSTYRANQAITKRWIDLHMKIYEVSRRKARKALRKELLWANYLARDED